MFTGPYIRSHEIIGGKKNSTIVDSKCERVLKTRLVQEKFLDMLASIPLKHCSELTLKGVLI